MKTAVAAAEPDRPGGGFVFTGRTANVTLAGRACLPSATACTHTASGGTTAVWTWSSR